MTLLLHELGGTLTARTPLPPWEGVQQYGSMVTYIRRYALTAMLGIATEDDDDGEAAAKPGRRPVSKPVTAPETPDFGGMVGFASAGKGDADMNLRMTPTGHALAFRLTENLGGTKGFKVLALDSLAEKLAAVVPQIEGSASRPGARSPRRRSRRTARRSPTACSTSNASRRPRACS